MKHARIIDGVALDVTSGDPAELFHPDLAVEFEPVPDEVETGWLLDDGEWSAPEAEPVEEVYVPLQLALIDFLRLFTTSELAAFNALRKACRALDTADYQAAAGGDLGKQALVGFEVFLTFYDALRNGLIELNQPQTVQGLQLLVPLGVLTAPRLAQVLANEPPE